MDYEQKYKEALERAKECHIDGLSLHQPAKDVIEYIFPELFEFEDERIRKRIIALVNAHGQGMSKESMLDWLEKQGTSYTKRDIDDAYIKGMSDAKRELEKQGEHKSTDNLTQQEAMDIAVAKCFDEQKSADMVEPKFKVGDWIANDYCVGKVIELTDDAYLLDTGQGIPFSCEHNVHLWTIEDAKDGDVLLFEGYYNSIVLFQGIGINGKGRINYHCKCDLGNYSFGIQGDAAYLGTIEKDAEHYHPATKEQRVLLFSKMKEAGYTFDFEKKELKEIHVIDEGKSEMDYCFTKMMNGEKVTPAWSEEDERNLQGVIDEIEANKNQAPDYDLATYDRFLSWLKSLKQRIGG